MPIKQPSDYKGKQPKQVRDLFEFFSIDGNGVKWEIDESMFFRTWGNNLTEYEQALVNLLCTSVSHRGRIFNDTTDITLLTATIWDSYGLRKLFKSYYENYTYWEGTLADFSYLQSLVECNIKECIHANRYKWGNLMRSCLEDFDPLNNVDATEETTRTLEQDGTVSNQKSGTETSKKTGTETSAKSGTETSARTGTERTVTDEETVDAKTGTETDAKTGAEQITYDTEEKTDYDGSEATTHQKAETTTESVTTTESSTFYDTKKTQDVGAANDNVDTLEYSNDRADTLSKTGTETTSFNNRQDQTTYNTTDRITHDNEVTTTHNTQDQLTHNTTDQLTHNTTDQLTHNTTDLESRDLLDTEHILHRRYGNIGITMSTQLLESFRNFVNYNLIDIVAHDIVNYISEGVY